MPTRKPVPVPPAQPKKERSRFASAFTRSSAMFAVALVLVIYEASPLHHGAPRPVLIGLYTLMMGLTPILEAANLIRKHMNEDDV